MQSFLVFIYGQIFGCFCRLAFFPQPQLLDISERNTVNSIKKSAAATKWTPWRRALLPPGAPLHWVGLCRGAETWLGCTETRLCTATSALCDWDVLNECYSMGTHVTWHWHLLWYWLFAFPGGRKADGTRVSPKLTHQNPWNKFKTAEEPLLPLIPHKFLTTEW